MRALVPIIFFICLPLSLIAQNNYKEHSFPIIKGIEKQYSPSNKQTTEYLTTITTDMVRWTFSYDSSGNVVRWIWEAQNLPWQFENVWRYTYSYDDKLVNKLDERWNGQGWSNSLKHTYLYDNSGKLVNWIREQWLNGIWVNQSRFTYTYDTSGNRISQLWEEWTGGEAWVNFDKITYTYVENQVKWEIEVWYNGLWYKNSRFTFLLDNSGNRLPLLTERWGNYGYVNEERYIYTFNSGNLVNTLYQRWSNNAWADSGRYSYTYQNSGSQISELYESKSQGSWVNDSRKDYNLNTNGNSIHGESYRFANNSWTPFKTYLKVYYHNGNDLFDDVPGSYFDAEYSTNPPAGINDKITTKNFSLEQNYPNPFNPSTKIRFSLGKRENVNLAVYDMLGRKVNSLLNEEKGPGEHEINFNSSGLASGVYIYRVTAGQYSESKSMVILK